MIRSLFFTVLTVFALSASAQNVGKLYRYNNSSTWKHFYTTSWDELGNGKYNFKYEGVVGFIFTSPVEGSSPMHRYFNPSQKSHFYTMSWEEMGEGKHGYNYEGIAYHAFKTEVPGSVALHRYFHQNNKYHFYTANFAELGKGGGGYIYEGVAGYIFPDESTALGAVKTSPVQTAAPVNEATQPVPAAAVSSAKSATSDYITIENGTNYSDFMPYWRTAILNSVVAVFHKNQPLMLIMVPANGSSAPVPGTYPIVEGSKRTVKKGSQVAKLEFEPGFVSVDGGELKIEYKNELFWFSADNITIMNTKTKETRKVSFAFSMFIQP